MSRTHSRLSRRIDFLSAVRRGMSSVVREHLQGYFEGEVFLDEKENKIYPFQVALKHKRWKVALDILENRDRNDGLLPEGDTLDEEYIEENQIDYGPAEAGTPVKQAINELLLELARERRDKPLPKPLRDRMLPFLDLLVESDGLDNTLLRILSFQPPWLDWPKRLLDAGANPNAWSVHKFKGVTLHTLEIAARNGLEEAVGELIERGADPHYKHHDYDLAVHRAARIKEWSTPAMSWYFSPLGTKLDILLSRKRCLDRLLEIEGMKQAPSIEGKDPLTLWREGVEVLEDSFMRTIRGLAEDGASEESQAVLMDKMVDFVASKTADPTAPKPDVRRMRL